MPRPYVSFKNKRNGKRVDYDGAYGYQCVDLFKQYMDEVLGIKCGQVGNAVDIWANKYGVFDSSWTRIPGVKDLMQGDNILFNQGTYGHIGIVDRIVNGYVEILDQNGGSDPATNGTGSDAIQIHRYLLTDKNILGVWRCEKIFNDLQMERSYCEGKLSVKDDKTTRDYMNSIRYQV